MLKTPIPFGKYYLLDRINVGGMAEVFQAKAFGLEGFERIVAVKRILPNIAEDKEFISMFIDEAKIAVQLNHANICQVFDLGKVGEAYFIAMEYVSGRDLRTIFERCKQRMPDGVPTMPLAQSCFVVMKVCEGLDYAHNKKDALGHDLNLVHRDVSPQNILISYEGEVKLIDFGIAKAAGKGAQTQAGILKGKFGYMSPEQVRGQPLDRRSDIFSVGILLYELLTGERLFVGESDFSTLEKIRNVEVVPPTTYNRKIPEELERIVLRALARDPEDRYQHAIDLHDDLQAFMYTSGEFYSRKELASWMKRVFRAEMEEERATLEAFRNFRPDGISANHALRARLGATARGAIGGDVPSDKPSSWTPERPAPSSTTPPPLPPPPRGVESAGAQAAPRQEPAPPVQSPARAASVPAQSREVAPTHDSTDGFEEEGLQTTVDALAGKVADFHWEEEELETHVYPGPPPGAEAPPEQVEGQTPAPVPAAGSPAEESVATPAAIPPPRVHAPAPAPAVEGPIRLGPPRRLPTQRLLWVGVTALVLITGGLGYWWLSSRPGGLILVTEPSDGLAIFINQKRVQETHTPAQWSLAPGTYQVSVQREGYLPWSQTLQVRSGQPTIGHARLESLAAKTGGFTIFTDPPGAKAILDGQDLGQVTPMKVQSVAPGVHRLELRLGDRLWSQEIVVKAGEMTSLQVTMPPAPTPPEQPPPAVAAAERPPPPRPAVVVAGQEPPRRPPDRVAGRRPEPTEDTPRAARPERSGGAIGFLRINSKPWTKIMVDGNETGLNTPQLALKLPPGEHKITLHNPQFNVRETFSVTIHPGETVTVIKDLLASKE